MAYTHRQRSCHYEMYLYGGILNWIGVIAAAVCCIVFATGLPMACVGGFYLFIWHFSVYAKSLQYCIIHIYSFLHMYILLSLSSILVFLSASWYWIAMSASAIIYKWLTTGDKRDDEESFVVHWDYENAWCCKPSSPRYDFCTKYSNIVSFRRMTSEK